VSAFSTDAKDEIAAADFEKACCPSAFWHAIVAFAGEKRDGAVIVRLRRRSSTRAALRAARAIGARAALKAPAASRTRRSTRLEISPDEVTRRAAGRVGARACCRRAFVRGAFLACGSVEDPRRGYHLEFACAHDAGARRLADSLASLGIDAGVSRRRGRRLVYIKQAAAVIDLLAQMRASRAVLAFDDVLAVRATKNAIRRKVNSELANAARVASAAVRQRDAVLRVAGRAGADRLGPGLREAIRLRIAHPEASLSELGARARPPVTKTTMAYRMRVLQRLARSDPQAERSHRKPNAQHPRGRRAWPPNV